MGQHVKTSREVKGLVTRVRPGVTRHAPHLPDIVLSVMGLVEVEQVLVEASVDMAMDQDVAIMEDLVATTVDLVATTEDLITITGDLITTTEDLVATMEASMGTMGASIMGAVFPTADMDRIVILAIMANTTMVNTTTVNTTMVSSLGPWPVSLMEGRHQRRRIA